MVILGICNGFCEIKILSSLVLIPICCSIAFETNIKAPVSYYIKFSCCMLARCNILFREEGHKNKLELFKIG